MSRRTCFILPGSCRCVRILRSAWRLPPGGPPASFGFLPRRGAAILATAHFPLPLSAFSLSYLVFLFIFFAVHSAPALPRVLHTFFIVLSSRHSPASTRYPVPFRSVRPPSFPSAASRFPPGTKTPPRPITEGVSLRPPIGAEPAFPARGMLAQFPHALAGGASHPCGRPPALSFPPGRGGASSCPRAIHGGADVTRGAHWALPLRDGGRPAHVKLNGVNV
jgi:hypothetical protein